MLQRLTTLRQIEFARFHIAEVISQHAEWFFTQDQGSTFALRRNEIEFDISGGRLILSSFTEDGIKSWRVKAWEWNGQSLILRASRRMGAESPLIELIPRASAKALAATIKAARQSRARKLATLACAYEPGTRIERCTLSPGVRRGEPGRYARVLLLRKKKRVAVTASVVPEQPSTVDAYLSSALLWFKRISEKINPPYIEELWLIISPEALQAVRQRVALLRPSLREIIKIFTVDSELSSLSVENCLERRDLWKKRLARFPPVPPAELTARTLQVIAEDPAAIDVVHARHGQTLRYLGLPFARVRTVMDQERVWFGIDGSHRRLLEDTTFDAWARLIDDLRTHRSTAAVDHRHALYRSAAEAWLESLLRKDITRLDPGLIIAPLHAQFRTARGGKLGVRPIDMLALRQDGRLVVIELKVSEDREHVLQGVDYWRRVESHRRRGHIAKARLFGERKILDEPPLVYLVAPMLRFHPSFRTLAACIDNDIEIYRFDINEDWRKGVRVTRRIRVN